MENRIKIIYGTGNKGKVEQVKILFKTKFNIDADIVSLKDINFDKEIEENGKTFEENSEIKAVAVKEFCNEKGINEIIITDDAGLCVDCLEGRPGVLSARYAGNHAPYIVVLNKLLGEMEGIAEEKRTAKFMCALTAILPNGKIIKAIGESKGRIATKIGKEGLLTYNPVFIPEGFDKVMSELPESAIGDTHRAKAFVKLINEIKQEME